MRRCAFLTLNSVGDFVVDDALWETGDAVLAAMQAPTLQARVDLVRRSDADGFWLMELELIEPSLYFRMDPAAPERFARAFVRSFPMN